MAEIGPVSLSFDASNKLASEGIKERDNLSLGQGDETVVNIGLGIGDAVHGLIAFPSDVLKYATCTDQTFGQRRNWNHFGEAIALWDNPLNRAADTVSMVVLGGADMLTAHWLNTVFNDKLELGIKYFRPMPKDERGWAAEITTLGIILVTPAIKNGLYKTAGIKPKPVARPVITERARPVFVPRLAIAPLSIMGTVSGFFKNAIHKARNSFELKTFEFHFNRMCKGDPNSFPKIKDTMPYYLTGRQLTTLVNMLGNWRKSGVNEAMAIEIAARNNAALFTPNHLAVILLTAKKSATVKNRLIWALGDIAKSNPFLFEKAHISALIELGYRTEIKSILQLLAEQRSEIFSGRFAPRLLAMEAYAVLNRLSRTRPQIFRKRDVPDFINTAQSTPALLETLKNLAEARPDLFKKKDIFRLAEAEIIGGNIYSPLTTLVLKRPELFTPDVLPHLIELESAGPLQQSPLIRLRILRPDIIAKEPAHLLADSAPRLLLEEHVARLIDKAKSRDLSLLDKVIGLRPDLMTPKQMARFAKIPDGALRAVAKSHPRHLKMVTAGEAPTSWKPGGHTSCRLDAAVYIGDPSISTLSGVKPTTFDFAISGKTPGHRSLPTSRIIVAPQLNGLGELTTVRFESGIIVQFSNTGSGAYVTMNAIKIFAGRRTVVFEIRNMSIFDWRPELVVTRGKRPIDHPLVATPTEFLMHVLREAANGRVVAL